MTEIGVSGTLAESGPTRELVWAALQAPAPAPPAHPRRPNPSVLRALACFCAVFVALLPGASAAWAAPSTSASTRPEITRAVSFLVDPARLQAGHYYEAFPGFADYGLTIDGALALAASGANDRTVKRIVDFLAAGGKVATSGQSVGDWSGIGTADVSGGSLAKEALLAQSTGYNPRRFGGDDLIVALDGSVCVKASVAPDEACAAAGNFRYSSSVFSQALGIIAQLRAHHAAQAASPTAYLESLQAKSGAWPSLISDPGKSDVDSTAMAVMALDLVDSNDARAAVTAGIAWIAGRQSGTGGFAGVDADSTNSTALAIQAMGLRSGAYARQLGKASQFLLTRQNADGGFDVSASTPGSDVRASTQALSGLVGTSFGTLIHDVSKAVPTSPMPTATTSTSKPPSTHHPSATATPSVSTTSRVPTTSLVPTTSRVPTMSRVPTSSRVLTTSAAPTTSGVPTTSRVTFGAASTVATSTVATSTVATSVSTTSSAGRRSIAARASATGTSPAAVSAVSADLAATGTPTGSLIGLGVLLIGAGSMIIAAQRRRNGPITGKHR